MGILEIQNSVLVDIFGDVGSESLVFLTADRQSFTMEYHQDCCANCSIEEIHGNLADLLGVPLIEASEEHQKPKGKKYEEDDSSTWTFYKFRTIKGSVTIRWYGSSNGYYSESPGFEKDESPQYTNPVGYEILKKGPKDNFESLEAVCFTCNNPCGLERIRISPWMSRQSRFCSLECLKAANLLHKGNICPMVEIK